MECLKTISATEKKPRKSQWRAAKRNWIINSHCFSPEEAMAPHSGTLAWKIPWTEEPGRLQSMGSHRVGHDRSDLAAAAAALPLSVHKPPLVEVLKWKWKLHQTLQLHLTLWPKDCSPPASSVHEILQAKILEWVAIPSSRGSSQPRDWTQVSHIVRRFFTIWGTREALIRNHIWLFITPWTITARILCAWNSPSQNIGVGSLLQRIFSTLGSNPGLPHCRWILYQGNSTMGRNY